MNHTFTTPDGLKLAYYVDDFTDPWRTSDTVLLLHAAMAGRGDVILDPGRDFRRFGNRLGLVLGFLDESLAHHTTFSACSATISRAS